MNWPKKILKEKRAEAIASIAFATTSALAFLLWRFSLGKTFEWTSISPISTPLSFGFYSALVFIGPGAYLYYFTNFYKDLWHFFRHTLNAPGLHKDVKFVIWISMCAMIYVVVKAVVDFLNFILTVIYNGFEFLLYLSPSLGAGLIFAVLIYLLLKKDWLIAKYKALMMKEKTY
jgi:hypothetical protein